MFLTRKHERMAFPGQSELMHKQALRATNFDDDFPGRRFNRSSTKHARRMKIQNIRDCPSADGQWHVQRIPRIDILLEDIR